MRKPRDLKAKWGAQTLLLIITGTILSLSGNVHGENAAKQILVTPPPMGWSSWNSFSNTVDSRIVMEQAKAMVSNGMAKLGYQYVNIDEGWWLGTRDAEGNIVVDAKA
jgi:Alpha galactosidase A